MRVFSNRHELFAQINFKKFVKKLEISGLTGRISGDPVDLGKREQLPIWWAHSESIRLHFLVQQRGDVEQFMIRKGKDMNLVDFKRPSQNAREKTKKRARGGIRTGAICT